MSLEIEKLQTATLKTTGGAAISGDSALLFQQGTPKNTAIAYRSALLNLSQWLLERTLTDELLADYLSASFYGKVPNRHGKFVEKSPASLAVVVAAVNWKAKHAGIESPAGYLTETMLAKARIAGRERGRGQVNGIEFSDMKAITKLASLDGVIGLRDAALISLMFDCLLRISEAVAVDILDLSRNALKISHSKSDQTGEGDTLFVSNATHKRINAYRKLACINDGALFRKIKAGDIVTENRLSVYQARRAIIKRSENADVEGFISGHSLRVGAAVSLAQAGAGGPRDANGGQMEIKRDAGEVCKGRRIKTSTGLSPVCSIIKANGGVSCA